MSRSAASRAFALLLGLFTALLLSVTLSTSSFAQDPPGENDEGENEDDDVPIPSPPVAPPTTAPSAGPATRSFSSEGDALQVYVITFGPGDHPFFKFGHNAIWIHDARRRTDGIYNFGTFAFNKPDLIPKFLQGRFDYWLSRTTSVYATTRAYARENRTMHVQLLDLSPEQKVQLRDNLEKTLNSDAKYYKYDYYRDNCSTRVRDAIDEVMGGAFKEQSTEPAALSYREQTLRLTYDFLPFYFALDGAMGDLIDQPVTKWEEMFVPMVLRDKLATATIVGPDGKEKPLVLREEQFLTAERPDDLKEPPSWTIWFWLTGIALGGAFFGLGYGGRKQRALRILDGLLLSVLGLIVGFLGIAYVLLWALTDHEVAHGNENILVQAPWLIAMTVLGIGVALGRLGAIQKSLKVVGAAAATSVLAVVLKVLPWFDQNNWRTIGLFLPLWIGIAAGLWFMQRDLPQWTKKPAKKTKAKKATDKKKDEPAKDEPAKDDEPKVEAKTEKPKAEAAKDDESKASKDDESKE